MRKPDWESGGVSLYLGDCLEILPTLGAGSIDAVITDPPYGINYASSRKKRMTGTERVTDASFGIDELNTCWLVPAFNCGSTNSCLYLFTRWDVLHHWAVAIETAGYSVVQRLVWDKRHWGMGDLRYYGAQTEDVLFCRKGIPHMQYKKRRGNLWSIWKGEVWRDTNLRHPTQKPEALMREFIIDSTKIGATILDPFMGSGTTGVACVQTDRSFIGIEIHPTYFDIAKNRIQQAQSTPRLL